MCLQDWRLGRFIRTTRRIVALPQNTSTLVANRDKDRVFIQFIATATTGVWNYDIEPISAIFTTPSLNPNGDPRVTFSLRDDGDFCQNPFYFFTSGLNITIAVIEGFLPESILAAHLDKLAGSRT